MKVVKVTPLLCDGGWRAFQRFHAILACAIELPSSKTALGGTDQAPVDVGGVARREDRGPVGRDGAAGVADQADPRGRGDAGARRLQRGAHRSAGGDAVVDHDRRLAFDRQRPTAAQVLGPSARDLGQLGLRLDRKSTRLNSSHRT